MQVNIHRGLPHPHRDFPGPEKFDGAGATASPAGNMIEAHVADPVNGRFNILDGIPRQLTVGNQRQFLVKFIIQLKKSFNC
jgi:hypothetical protein